MSLLHIDRQVDARGLSCPMPIVLTARAVKSMSSGTVLEVVTTDPGSVADFEAWSAATGHQLVDHRVVDREFRFTLRIR